eukprot:359138-Chlamydomonas_euryale.AAC.3
MATKTAPRAWSCGEVGQMCVLCSPCTLAGCHGACVRPYRRARHASMIFRLRKRNPDQAVMACMRTLRTPA